MASIFISYRRKDYATGVSALEQHLRSCFGQRSIMLDQDGFLGGTDWRAEMRSAVIQSSVVICAVGNSWCEPSLPKSGPDYLHEELKVARSLGKPVIPVIVGNGEGKPDLSKLPADIAWLGKLHAVDCTGPDLGRIKALERAISSNISSDTAQGGTLIGAMFTDLFYSLLYPVSAGGIALRGTASGITSALLGVCLSTAALFMLGMVLFKDLDALESLGKILGVIFIFVGLIYGLASLVIRLGPARTHARGRFAYSLRFCAAIISCWVLYFSLWAIFAPENVLKQLKNVWEEGGLVPPNNMEALNELPGHIVLVLIIFNLSLIFHLLYIAWGFVRSMAAVVRTGRLSAFLFFSALVAGIGAMEWITLSISTETRTPDKNIVRMADQLPREFSLSNGADKLTETGTELMPIKIYARGTARFDHNMVILDFKELKVENRTDGSIVADRIHFTLAQRVNGKFSWTDPVPYSNTVAIGSVEGQSERRLENFSLRARLHPSMKSGETGLTVWVTINSKSEYPLSDGGDAILRW
ncbi:toll/interleukin-1 receptor domain-containing protein [Pseudomonas sp. LPH60]|uniref:toll/interleukin-1 receptor domain-containing protein n=1 Tax=Pseudomonas sp. LPH60 TaxID=3065906 RepID=UPI00273B9B30|nr:toll/interleukin-1 receptor domain-containing protein [Pseudomonas sp. LPH60]MDP4571928.1 toll/interleukin-1 receptor domain-containing protein [Pseudomonas sp. LPH60]